MLPYSRPVVPGPLGDSIKWIHQPLAGRNRLYFSNMTCPIRWRNVMQHAQVCANLLGPLWELKQTAPDCARIAALCLTSFSTVKNSGSWGCIRLFYSLETLKP